MNPIRKRKLLNLLFIFLIIATATALVLYALGQNISLFYTPTQVALGEAPINRPIRVGGMVEKGSIVRSEKTLDVKFNITDFKQTIAVTYTGILPDLFRDEQGVVAEVEVIDKQHVHATRVLAKHDANYMPPEVKAALAQKENP